MRTIEKPTIQATDNNNQAVQKVSKKYLVAALANGESFH